MSYYMRHTMGQDWGGRRKENPDNCPKISGKQVREKAKYLGIEVKRNGYENWWYKNNGQWYTGGTTNYICWKLLDEIFEELK